MCSHVGVCTCVCTYKSELDLLLCYSSAPSHLVYEAGSLTGTCVRVFSEFNRERKGHPECGWYHSVGSQTEKGKRGKQAKLGIWEAM